MRSKRKRTVVKLDSDYVDLDSDELDQLIEEDEPASRKMQSSRSNNKKQKQAPAAAAAAGVDPDDEDYTPDEITDAAEAPAAAAAVAAAGAVQNAEVAEDSAEYFSLEGDSDGDSDGEGGDADAESSDYDSKPAGSKKAQQQAKEKKPRKKRQSTRRLCASYAKAEYHLTDRDLADLTDIEYKRNPHYRNAAPMKLYLVRELEVLAAEKAKRKGRTAEEKEEIAAARALEARARKAAAAAAAAEATKAFELHAPKEERHGSLQLPDTCLTRILSCLVDTLEPGGMRGPSAVAKDIATASLVCWDFYHAAKVAFVDLGSAAPTREQQESGLLSLPGPEALGGWPFWDKVLQQPTNLKLVDLKAAARQLGLTVTGTKAELMLRVLGAFSLSGPTTAPAQLLTALLVERGRICGFAWDGPNVRDDHSTIIQALNWMQVNGEPGWKALSDARAAKGAAGLRAAATAAGFKDLAEMKAAGEAARDAYRAKEEQQRQERMARWQAEQARIREQQRQRAEAAAAAAAAYRAAGMPPQPVYGRGNCACGNAAAGACTRGCCGKCCRERRAAPGAPLPACPRHGN